MAETAQKEQSKTERGFIVQRQKTNKNDFLSRSGNFVRHEDVEQIKGINFAWVHSLDAVFNGGHWVRDAEYLFIHPAQFNAETGFAEVIGEAMSYNEFITI